MKNREEYIAILEVESAELKKRQRDLIKYLEDKIKELKQDIENFVPDSWCGQTDCYIEDRMEGSLNAYQGILERVKSGKYD